MKRFHHLQINSTNIERMILKRKSNTKKTTSSQKTPLIQNSSKRCFPNQATHWLYRWSTHFASTSGRRRLPPALGPRSPGPRGRSGPSPGPGAAPPSGRPSPPGRKDPPGTFWKETGLGDKKVVLRWGNTFLMSFGNVTTKKKKLEAKKQNSEMSFQKEWEKNVGQHGKILFTYCSHTVHILFPYCSHHLP